MSCPWPTLWADVAIPAADFIAGRVVRTSLAFTRLEGEKTETWRTERWHMQ
jgi:hypothetical protein